MTEQIKENFGFEEAKKLFNEFHFRAILEEIEWQSSDDKDDTIAFLKEEFQVSEEVIKLLESS